LFFSLNERKEIVTDNQLSDAAPNPGGAAPAHRQCQYAKADGHRCRDWAIRGHQLCARHGLFRDAHPDHPIDVPLLEDEASIVLLLSQTLRALAWGRIPVSNGRALLAGCRLAYSMHCNRLETAKFRLKLRRLNIPENEIFEPASPLPEPDAPPEPADPSPEPGALSSEPCSPPPPKVRFRELKKNWDKELLRSENEITDMYAPRYGESREEFNASRATPFQDLVQDPTLPVPAL
jgi:hypothetical protein